MHVVSTVARTIDVTTKLVLIMNTILKQMLHPIFSGEEWSVYLVCSIYMRISIQQIVGNFRVSTFSCHD